MMDPRQRMMLETAWQALEDAGMDPGGLRGSRTGIYAGIGTSEYRDLMTAGAHGISYLSTAASMAVGRVAFHLGVEGPTLPVELNCASSLVAVHYAVAALHGGEVDMALVGGVAAVLSAGVNREMADLRLLSPRGVCSAFDARADGFVRGEGCGMVVLKRLGDAVAGGDCIWGVIRGSAVNQNGASAGPTVPNGQAQERVIEEALSRAGVMPCDVDYLEAHGAGSELGDTIEVQAAAAVYGRGRKAERPLLMGSVKTNIGHLEPAAGVAGLIKTVLAMRRGLIPKQLNFESPNAHLDWERLPVRVTSEAVDWPLHPDGRRRAAVSAFGISGTNAHVIVEGYDVPAAGSAARDAGPNPSGAALSVPVTLPDAVFLSDSVSLPDAVAAPDASSPAAAERTPLREARLLPLSAKTSVALRQLAARYLAWLDARDGDLSPEPAASESLLSDMAWTAAVGRSHLEYRRGLVFGDAASLREGLKALAEASEEPQPAPAVAGKVAFVYAGAGSQWAGMGQALYDSEPVLRAVLDRCDDVLREDRGASLLDVMFGRESAAGDLDDPLWAQPAIYALACGLTALWSSLGVAPSVVAGQDLGELAAAQAAGVFGLEDGLRLACLRGAAVSPDDLATALAGVAFAPPSLVLVSSLSGRAVEWGDTLDGPYWCRQAREPVAFAACVETLAEQGAGLVVEIGPHAVLGPAVTAAWPSAGEHAGGHAAGLRREPPVVLSSLRQWAPPSAVSSGFVTAVARAYESGIDVSFTGLFAGETRRRISLPSYPFQRRRHWIEAPGNALK